MPLKECQICRDQRGEVSWKDAEFLRQFMDGLARIQSRFATGLCAKHQRRVARAIRRARVAGIVPFVSR